MDIPDSDREGDLPHPRETLDLIGHESAERELARALSSGRMPSAWLIGGPRGVGKATLAYRFIRALLGGGPVDPDADAPLGVADTAPIVRAIAHRTHPDLLVLRRPFDEKAKRFKQTLPIEEVRNIHPFFGRHAGAGGWRVCLVDAADDLGTGAANALLKSLEEPPQRAVFLILAHAPARLLPTIRSRCRRLMLHPLGETEVARWLAHKDETLGPDDALALARLGEGGPGRALALAASGGLDLYRHLDRVLRPTPEPAHVFSLADRLARAEAAQDYQSTMELVSLWLTRLVRAGNGRAAPEVVPGEARHMDALRAGGRLEHWVELWENLQHLVARADAVALDRRQVFLSIVAGVGRVAQGGSPELLLERI